MTGRSRAHYEILENSAKAALELSIKPESRLFTVFLLDLSKKRVQLLESPGFVFPIGTDGTVAIRAVPGCCAAIGVRVPFLAAHVSRLRAGSRVARAVGAAVDAARQSLPSPPILEALHPNVL